jgi:hypothetical protein
MEDGTRDCIWLVALADSDLGKGLIVSFRAKHQTLMMMLFLLTRSIETREEPQFMLNFEAWTGFVIVVCDLARSPFRAYSHDFVADRLFYHNCLDIGEPNLSR